MGESLIVGPPLSGTSLIAGITSLNKVLSLTLGPDTNRVAIANPIDKRAVELVGDGAILSQRILELPNPLEDMGNQILKKAIAQLVSKANDGAASCSVLTEAILRFSRPLLAAGFQPLSITDGLQVGARWVAEEISRQARPIDTMEEIESVLISAMIDPRLASLTAEILDTIGPEGSLLIEETRHVGLAHEYVQGARWTGGLISPYLLSNTERESVSFNPLILVSACPVHSADQIVPALEVASSSSSRNLMIIAPGFSNTVVGLLIVNMQEGVLNSIVAVPSPKSVHFGAEILEDINVLVGGRLIGKDEPQALKNLKVAEFGRASRVWATRSAFGVVGGGGDRNQISMRARWIRSQIATESDTSKRAKLSERAGNLAGISAILRIGSSPSTTRSHDTRQAQKASAIARQALLNGVVPGGGAALAHCASRLLARFAGTRHEVGAKVLAQSLYEPMRVIAANAGAQPALVIDRLRSEDASRTYDVLSHQWVDCSKSGLWDPLEVVRASLDTAVSTALMVLSTDVLVRRKRPPITQDLT